MPRTRDTPVREVVCKPGYQQAVSRAIPPSLFNKCDAFYCGALRFPDPSVTSGRPKRAPPWCAERSGAPLPVREGAVQRTQPQERPSPIVCSSTGQWIHTPESSNVLGIPFAQWLPVTIAPDASKQY